MTVAWSSRRQQGGRDGVFIQRFTPNGQAVGSETAIGIMPGVHQTQPAIAVDALGVTWAVWQAFGQDGEAGAIIGRRFDPELVGGDEFAVNQEARGHQSNPCLTVLADGRVAVAWTSQVTGKSEPRVRIRLFAADGTPTGDEFGLPATARFELAPAIVAQADGGFAIAYSIFDDERQPAGICLQRFHASGLAAGPELNVSGPRRASQIEPAIAATPDGLVVAWLDAESDGDDYGVLARRFDRAGQPLGEPFLVNTTRSGPQNAAAIAVARDGRFAIAWNGSDGDDAGVYAQLFAPDGQPLGGEFRLNRCAAGPQALRAATGAERLAFGADDQLVCAWSGNANCGDKSSANVTLLTPRPLELAGPQGITPGMRPAAATELALAGPEPHRPPTFDPRLIEHAEREVLRGDRFGFTGVVSTGWTPPDPHMAVGPGHVVVMTNGAIAWFDKQGNLQFQDEIEDNFGFWGSVGATGFVFDPEVVYDELSERFFAMAAEAYAPPGQTKSYVLIAVSDDSDPNGTWYKYRFDTTALAGNLFDSPNIGVSDDAVLITGDGFGISANYPVYTFDKASLLAGLPPLVQRSLTLSTSTQSAGIPPVLYDSPPAFYMLEHAEGTNRNTVRLIALRDLLGAPYFTTYTLSVPIYSAPGDPPQQGTSVRPETFDARFWSVAYRDGYLWGTHHINSSPVRARWYQIAMNGWPTSGSNPTVVQVGDIAPSPMQHTFFSAITVNANGDAALTCARSSPTSYLAMLTTYRLSSDPLNSLRPVEVASTSNGPDDSGRWGDYAAVQPDPLALNRFWAHHEYRQSGWRTWVQMIETDRGDADCSGNVNFGDINPFILAMTNPPAYEANYPGCPLANCDINGDGVCDFGDINAFVALLTAP
jgi:hypothetical protein